MRLCLGLGTFLIALLSLGVAQAQPPDLRQMAGRPLPVADLPVGTVSVRVARKLPANAAANVEVRALVKLAGAEAEAEPKIITATTGQDGRAAFADLPPGSTFQATAEVDGETLETQAFAIPAAGGVRTMLIAGLGAAPAGGAPSGPGAEPKLNWSVTLPAPTAAPDLPAGVLEVTVKNKAGEPLPNHRVNLGQASAGGQMQAFDQMTNASGVARFEALSTAQDVGYLLVTEVEGMRLGSRPFRMPTEGGLRMARMGPPESTNDPSVLSLDQGSRFIFEVREDYLFVGEVLSFRNESDRVFDGGPGGLFLPLPSEMTSFQPFGDGVQVEEVKGKGLLMLSPVPPTGPRERGPQARFGFLLPTYGDDTLVFEQTMPLGMTSPLLIIPDSYQLAVEGEGLRTLPKEKDQQGNAVSLYELPNVPAGGTIKLTFRGLPSVDRTGHIVAIVISVLLVAWGVWGALSVKRADTEKVDRKRQDLRNRREKLFDELVALERKRRDGGDLDTKRRDQLVAQLESVYRDLQALDRQV